ncbi:MAG: rod shape-determining protein MreD [Legionellales bacterium RIFCSPHIGHO2_12_FULL_37_14]|nr:MAG: rod shape-determining protein MreD [Legionellales bacterium RIFCSPHIGHO2_12_FULL_37_14]
MSLMILRHLAILMLIFIINLLPISQTIHSIMPPWMLIFLFYTSLVFGMSYLWILVLFTGLMLDVFEVSFLGEHVIALTSSLWSIKLQPNLMHNSTMHKQMYWLWMVTLIYQMTIFLLSGLLHATFVWYYFVQIFVSSLLSVLLWPSIKTFLDSFFNKKLQFAKPRILDQY